METPKLKLKDYLPLLEEALKAARDKGNSYYTGLCSILSDFFPSHIQVTIMDDLYQHMLANLDWAKMHGDYQNNAIPRGAYWFPKDKWELRLEILEDYIEELKRRKP